MLLHLFVVKFHFGKVFFFNKMAIILVKEARLIVAMDDLDFGIRDVVFEAKVFNRYGTFD